MNLNYLKYFIAVAEFNSFTYAAEYLFITQPTLSVCIQKLESSLGVKLLNRTKKGQKTSISLTISGEYFLGKAKDIVNQFESVKDELRHDYVNTKTLKLGTLPSISTNLAHKLIINLRKAFPHIITEQVTGSSLDLENWLDRGAINIALNVFSEKEEKTYKSDEASKMLFDRNYLVALAQGHALAKKKSFSVTELNGTPYIDRMECEIRSYVQKVFKERNICPQITGRTQHIFLANSLVASGVGVAIIPDQVKIPGVTTLPFSDFNISRFVGLKWRTDEDSEIVDFLVNFPVLKS